ncbi:MAG: phosphatidate cytidylyltransferase [Desulfomonile sp.]|nr:phosphatidate cytidylyltransferase [Desulfomonile sp.]
MLRDRLITAGILIVILVPLVMFGGSEGIALLVAVLGSVGLWELCRALPALRDFPGKELTLVLGLFVVAAFYVVPVDGTGAVLCGFPLVVMLIHLVLYHRVERTVESASQMIFALAYVAVPLSHAILLQRLEMGYAWVLLLLVVICFGDTGAYFAGRAFGKHRLAPSVSPSKTIEGLAGCIAANFVGMICVKAVFWDLPSFRQLFWVTVVLAIAGPFGDLFASMLKRRLGVKDFGSVMRGHGGVLDRADSLIPAIPALYYYLIFSGIASPR